MAKRIIVVGSGFAGMWSALSAARALYNGGSGDGSVEIVVIAPEPSLHVRPRFYEPNPAAMKAPLTAVFDAVGIRYAQGTVERIRTDDREVEASRTDGSRFTMTYDRLVLAAGSKLFRPAIPGLREHGFSIDQLDEAAVLESHLATLATVPDTPARNTVVIAGGGFTGIEIATEMPARLRAILGPSAKVNVIVVEQAPEIGPDLGPGPRPVIRQALEALGVSWRVNAAVTSIDRDGLSTSSGERIETKTVVWTAGLRASSLTEQIPARRDRLGRLHVARDLRVEGVPNVFATGDVALAATDDEGHHAMMSCQHAMNLGRFAGHNAAADLTQQATIPYSQPKYVTCLDLGPWGAVYTEGWERVVKLAGAEVKNLKRRINSEWIYPPRADREEILAAADPARTVVA
jgi:NADH:ubiquinone reductase (H+-translocating)